MEIQDKANLLAVQVQNGLKNPEREKMQLLRFKRFAALFKTGLIHCMHIVDLYKIFYKSNVNHFVSPQLRKDLIEHCFPGFISNPSKLALINQSTPTLNKQSVHPLLFCYFVILEANDNPYAVTERLEKSVIDQAFDNARIFLLGKQQRQNSKNTQEDEVMADAEMKAFEKRAGGRICFHLAKYFKAINSVDQAKQLFRKAIKMGERYDGEALKILEEIQKTQKPIGKPELQSQKEESKMEVDHS